MSNSRTIPQDIDPAPEPDEATPPPARPVPQAAGTPKAHGEHEHIGATEDQVSDTTAPAGKPYKDEPRQG